MRSLLLRLQRALARQGLLVTLEQLLAALMTLEDDGITLAPTTLSATRELAGLRAWKAQLEKDDAIEQATGKPVVDSSAFRVFYDAVIVSALHELAVVETAAAAAREAAAADVAGTAHAFRED